MPVLVEETAPHPVDYAMLCILMLSRCRDGEICITLHLAAKMCQSSRHELQVVDVVDFLVGVYKPPVVPPQTTPTLVWKHLTLLCGLSGESVLTSCCAECNKVSTTPDMFSSCDPL